jgi:CO/xanthine dehydrogenase Mo-binding subunit
MGQISGSVVKRDHSTKFSGAAIYVGDYMESDILTGKILHSQKAHAKLIEVKVPELPAGYYYVDRRDVPGDNNVNIVKDDMPVFARETVEYIGEAIGMVCGPDESMVEHILSAIEVVYEDLPVVTDVLKSDTAFFDYTITKGDIDKAFKEADKVYEEVFETGFQDQTYLETQGMMAEPQAEGRVFLHGSLQCPYYVLNAVTRALGLPREKVHIAQDATGGGFGGKEDYPSILGCQVGVAAVATGHKVRCIFGRREDLEFTPKKHPSHNTYKVAVKDGRVTAMDVDVIFNGGAYTTLSAVVLQRGIICANGVYDVPNLHIRGRAIKTNTVPSGAYRGFGGPQTFVSVEMVMDHIARDLGIRPLEFKLKHLVKKGDSTSTSGKYHFDVPIVEMVEELDRICDYRKKREMYAKPQTGRYRRGIGLSMCFHGAGFTGSGERDFIKAVVRLKKSADGMVTILISNTDMGQGLRTIMPKIVAKELDLPLTQIIYEYPDTDFVPDSGPTVASRSTMVVGELLCQAAKRLRAEWQDGEEQMIEEHYKHPEFLIPFSLDDFKGDAYPTYSWLVNVIELEIDTYTGRPQVLGAYGCFDVGTPIDYNIVVGQMEGGFLQSIGYASMEYMTADKTGRIRNNSFSDYIIPTAMDVPNLKVILHTVEYPEGPYGAKGAGELPAVGAPGAYMEAVEQALESVDLHHIPFTAEDVLKSLEEAEKK